MHVTPLLDFIAHYESRGDLNAVWGRIKIADRPIVPLTSMTVGQVLDWQDSIDAKYMSEAAGAWQFMEDTLRGLYREAGVPLTAKFDDATQERLATALLKRRGLDDYLAGRMTDEAFANSLAKEWASLPVVTDVKRGDKLVRRGQSYYAGDGLNAAHAPVEGFLEAVRGVRGKPAVEPRENVAQTKTAKGAGASGLGLLIQQAGEQISALVPTLPQGTGATLQIVGTLLIVGGIAYTIWARMQDWKAGDR